MREATLVHASYLDGDFSPCFVYMVTLKVSGDTVVDSIFYNQDLWEVAPSSGKKECSTSNMFCHHKRVPTPNGEKGQNLDAFQRAA